MRWQALTGLAFVVCFGLAVVLYGSGAGSSDAQITAYYASASNIDRQIAGFSVLLLGCICLIVYAVVSCYALVPAGAARTVAVASGAGAGLLLAIGNALWATSAFTVRMQTDYQITPATHLLVEDAGFVVVIVAMAVAVPYVVVTSTAAWRRRTLPLWFVWLGVAAAVGLAAAYWYLPMGAFLLWTASGSVLLSRAHVGLPTPST